MQNNSHFVKLNKIFIITFGFIMLLCLIAAAQTLSFEYLHVKSTNVRPEESMYMQLKTVSDLKNSPSDDIIKMNNLNFENSYTAPSVNNKISINTIKLLNHSQNIVTDIDLEYYVLCSLLAEMPQSFESDALMAQAVACRTFAVKSALDKTKHKDADICTDYRCCQSFLDASSAAFDISKANDAVLATRGIIAVYEGKPILAAYHSSSVGYTKSSAQVWGGKLDYLTPVMAAEAKEDIAHTVKVSKKQFKSALKKHGLGNDFDFIYLSDGLCAGISSGNTTLTAKQIQNIFSLRSDSFIVNDTGNEYEFVSYGFGHGVGMSQYGADALAKSGYDFYEILKYYYTGISFEFIN